MKFLSFPLPERIVICPDRLPVSVLLPFFLPNVCKGGGGGKMSSMLPGF